jgi:hypothetical protein
LGIAANLFFVHRKENRLGRAFLLTVLGLLVGALVGNGLLGLNLGLLPETAMSWGIFLILWLVSGFLR